MIASSISPVMLLDGDLTIIAASTSFYRAFSMGEADVIGRKIFDLGAGEWNAPQLQSSLKATVAGYAEVEGYEMALVREGQGSRSLVLDARKLDYVGEEQVRLLLAVSDVTEARLTEKLKDDLLREKDILLREIQHRVANSLQIICSVLLQSARHVRSKETRDHLEDAHNRVMSIAAVQHQLAASGVGEVELRSYLTRLCESISASMIRDHKQLRMIVDVDDSVVDSDISISLGLMVTELAINALKHAFPATHKGSGQIFVSYRSTGRDWVLTVTDNGVGMRLTPTVAKAGLGSSIVEALARQLDARIDVAGGEPGTKISVVHIQAAAHASGGNKLPIIRAV